MYQSRNHSWVIAMAIQDQDLYHGAAIVPIVEHPRFKAINKPRGSVRGEYLLNADTPLLVKYATGPNTSGKWTFDFTAEHLRTARRLDDRHPGRFFVVFVCVKRAVCALTWSELSVLVTLGSQKQQTVYVEVPKGKPIKVSGDLKVRRPSKKFER